MSAHFDVRKLIIQPFRHFTYVTAHSPSLLSLYLRHSSFSKPPVALPTSQLILQPFHCFTYITAHSPTLPSPYLHHSSFSNPSVASPTSQLILQPFRRFTYITAHSPTLPSPYLHHSSFSNPSVASPTLQLILQPFCRFTYITAQSPILLLFHLRHSLFSNPSFASPTSQAIHLIHLASRTWCLSVNFKMFSHIIGPRTFVFMFVRIWLIFGVRDYRDNWEKPYFATRTTPDLINLAFSTRDIDYVDGTQEIILVTVIRYCTVISATSILSLFVFNGEMFLFCNTITVCQ